MRPTLIVAWSHRNAEQYVDLWRRRGVVGTYRIVTDPDQLRGTDRPEVILLGPASMYEPIGKYSRFIEYLGYCRADVMHDDTDRLLGIRR